MTKQGKPLAVWNPKAMLRARDRMGMSQHDLARAVGVSQQAVGKWEHGVCAPRTSVLLRVCKALNLDPANCYGGRP